MRSSSELREAFLAFFESKSHLRRPSGSLVPAEFDPSVLLTTAGMQPLKPYFLGLESPPSKRLATVQKCFRTTDIDSVGLTPRHLTFFEMLGNFSIGDYFKDEAIALAWEFITEHMGLPEDSLWITVFAGDPELALGRDEVAVEGWKAVGVPSDRIVQLPRSENFWQAGPTGPSGPCSEIYFDHGADRGCDRPDCAPGCECDRFLEFWNLVFMEFDLREDGTLTPLPAQSIDTGLGVERGASILQGVDSVYETDGFKAVIDWVELETGARYGSSEGATKANRVLADHGRGMTFLVADGVTPSNEGRGYILRRVIRRAIQHGSRIGLESPLLERLAEVVTEHMGEVYPELRDNHAEIARVLAAEEDRFARTLATGMDLFDRIATDRAISGADAFMLHDTYGFPLEITRELAAERGLQVDEDEFHRLMGEQRERSRSAAETGVGAERAATFSRTAGLETEFVGYEKTEALTQLGALEDLEDGVFLGKLRESPFYVEGGGQVTDTGRIEREDGAEARVAGAYRFGEDQVLMFQGDGFAAGDRVRAIVSWKVRFPTMTNHTGTHLLHQALRDVLGTHVNQAGSAVRPDKLRFDFTHPQSLTVDERTRVEEIVNDKIFENLPVRAFLTPIAEARRLGAMMLFGEKYGEVVRVIEIPGFSVELCGGTHVRSTAEIGPFVILSEGSVGSGVRRIEAVTSGESYALLRARSHEAEELRLELTEARKKAKKKAAAPTTRDDLIGGLLAEAKDADGIRIVTADLGEMEADPLLDLSDRLKQQAAPAAVVLGATNDGGVHLVANFDPEVNQRGADAVEIVKAAAAVVGGGGGGRSTMARAGGKDPSKLAEALATAERALLESLS